jgi:molecular chaperone DnaJ
LSDKTKRAQYDQFGKTFEQAGAQGGFSGDFSGFDFGDIFGRGFEGGGYSAQGGQASGWEEVFSDIFGDRFGQRRGTRARAGSDIQVDVEISFEEMVRGATRTFNLYKTVICDVCRGTGGEPGSKEETCPTCKGSGQVRKTSRSFFGSFTQVTTCPTCQGTGRAYSQKCRKCGGDGRLKAEEAIKVEIPAGIADGQTISLPGKGEAGEPGAPAGDLYVNVRVRSHPKFKRVENNITSNEQISFSQAALGDKIDVETVDGTVKMKIPSGTQSGEIFRIRDKGVPQMQRRGRGDHLVKIIVKIPKHLSRDERDSIEKLKELGI